MHENDSNELSRITACNLYLPRTPFQTVLSNVQIWIIFYAKMIEQFLAQKMIRLLVVKMIDIDMNWSEVFYYVGTIQMFWNSEGAEFCLVQFSY